MNPEQKAQKYLDRMRRDRGDMNSCDWSTDYTDIFEAKPMVDWIEEAKNEPDMVPLWLNLWHEKELAFLYANSGVGKTVYAMQIAIEIAKTRRVLYIDTELHKKSLEKRYTDGERNIFPINRNFIRAESPDCSLHPEEPPEAVMVKGIEQLATTYGCNVIIIDNIGSLGDDMSKTDEATRLIKRLLDLRNRRGFSILVLAHKKKMDIYAPLSQNDLAGSKNIINFCDTAFAIGESPKDGALRYVKHIKARNTELVYGEDNVLAYEQKYSDGWIHFEPRGESTERGMLAEPKEKEEKELTDKVCELNREGMSLRDIARRVGVSHTKVARIIKRSADA